MDWSKAKTILIVAFLITNVLLGSVIVYKNKRITPTLREDFIEELKGDLLEKDIRIACDIPKTERGLVPLTVRYESLDEDFINKKLYEGKASIDKAKEELVIEGLNSRVLVKKGKIFKYVNKSKVVKYENFNEDVARQIAEDFIDLMEFRRDDMELTYITQINDHFRLVYSKKYEDTYVEKAYINMSISNMGLESCERVWLDLKQKGDVEIYTSTAPKAILSLVNMEEAYGREIVDISLCYYFDPNQHDYIESLENAKEGKTVPAWRILFADGNRIMIDDY